MRDKIFIDSNIFLYAFNDDGSSKHKIASEIIMSSHDYHISLQVINEVSNNMLKKLDFKNDDVIEFITDSYKRFYVMDITQETFLLACELRDSYNISYYDSLILSSAISSGCTTLYSEDMQHNQKIKDLTIINPFKISRS